MRPVRRAIYRKLRISKRKRNVM